MLKDQQKPHVVTRYKGNFLFFVFFNSLIIYITGIQKQTLINN